MNQQSLADLKARTLQAAWIDSKEPRLADWLENNKQLIAEIHAQSVNTTHS